MTQFIVNMLCSKWLWPLMPVRVKLWAFTHEGPTTVPWWRLM